MNPDHPPLADPHSTASLKKKSRRLSTKEVLLIASPFPVLWLVLGLTVHPSVFTPWAINQHVGKLAALTLYCVPPVFTFIYLVGIYATYRGGKPIGATTVLFWSVFAFVLAWVLTPLP